MPAHVGSRSAAALHSERHCRVAWPRLLRRAGPARVRGSTRSFRGTCLCSTGASKRYRLSKGIERRPEPPSNRGSTVHSPCSDLPSGLGTAVTQLLSLALVFIRVWQPPVPKQSATPSRHAAAWVPILACSTALHRNWRSAPVPVRSVRPPTTCPLSAGRPQEVSRTDRDAGPTPQGTPGPMSPATHPEPPRWPVWSAIRPPASGEYSTATDTPDSDSDRAP